MWESLCGELQTEATSVSAYWREAVPGQCSAAPVLTLKLSATLFFLSFTLCLVISVHIWGMREKVFFGLQSSNSCQDSHRWSSICLSIWWMQQEVCPVHKSQVSHTDSCKSKVSENLSLVQEERFITILNNKCLCTCALIFQSIDKFPNPL